MTHTLTHSYFLLCIVYFTPMLLLFTQFCWTTQLFHFCRFSSVLYLSFLFIVSFIVSCEYVFSHFLALSCHLVLCLLFDWSLLTPRRAICERDSCVLDVVVCGFLFVCVHISLLVLGRACAHDMYVMCFKCCLCAYSMYVSQLWSTEVYSTFADFSYTGSG